jgi:integrase
MMSCIDGSPRRPRTGTERCSASSASPPRRAKSPFPRCEHESAESTRITAGGPWRRPAPRSAEGLRRPRLRGPSGRGDRPHLYRHRGRVSEVAGLRVEDANLDQLTLLLVQTKGRAPRFVGIGNRTAKALDRYLRVRRAHPEAHTENLWLGSRGPMTPSGIRQLTRRRAAQAGLEHLHPHQFRHTFAH